MNARTWIALFRHIPPEKQSQFTLITANGTEMTVQNFIRIEEEFVLLKGRLSGSQDSGRVFFIPYTMIDTFSYTNPVRDTEVEELFGSLRFDVAPDAVPPAPPGVASPSRMLAPPAPAPKPAIRSEVLERFRSGRAGASSLNLPRPSLNGD
jgi:hypothetical protein